jgi:glycosidase
MIKLLLLLLIPVYTFSQVTSSPTTIEINQSVTITVDLLSNASDCNGLSNPSKVYLHSGVGNETSAWATSVVGNWGQDDGVGEMTNIGGGIWSITFTPQTYYGLSAQQAGEVTRIGMVFRSADGTQELKNNGCADFIFNVGAFQVTMINPNSSGIILLNSGQQTQVIAQNTNGAANYELKINGSSFHSNTGTTFYQSPFITNVTDNMFCELIVSQGTNSITKSFNIFVNNTSVESIPSNLVDGINYNTSDTSKATLVLQAPLKDFVYVTGSFNNWNPSSLYAMKKDTNTGTFWIELTGLTPGQIETYQYWVYDQSPISGSPYEVKTADPYSTLVLSPFDDSYIPDASYPNMPVYPLEQDREVSVLQTGQNPYNWQVTDFQKPAKEDLVIYELLIRDFDTNRNFQDVIDRIDYFKNLNINAIELMPVMEFEGNESWGYNTAFHMALDKFYGSEDKFRELVDVCHQNGIAVILDLALNHAFGRNPMVRMWMDDPDNNGWGEPSSENPYFNETATHTYSVGSDFNHSSALTKKYSKRVVKHWIENFKIDGFRWDLTKGFTQNCTDTNSGCTDNYQADRVAILKEYADYSWSLDPDHYVIFEHLGSTQEQKEWADYRIDEGKGIMLWGKMTSPYNQLTMGFISNSNINGMGHNSQNFIGKRLVGYSESHDEERLMYNNQQYGASNGSYDVTTLTTALERIAALGAITLTIPGPKMIWHFGELGMENSIFTCNDGTVNESGGNDGDCKLDTKPQPQWADNWTTDTARNEIYTTWSRLNALKINEAVFEGSYSINSGTLTPKIYIWDDSIATTELKNIVIISNFDLSNQNVVPNFPYTGVWYDLMDASGDTTVTVSNTSSAINLPPGTFKIFGNKPASTLMINDLIAENMIEIYPSPAHDYFKLNQPSKKIVVYDLIGKVTQTFKGNFSSESHFDVSNLKPGIYLVHIQSKRGTTTRKLLKY